MLSSAALCLPRQNYCLSVSTACEACDLLLTSSDIFSLLQVLQEVLSPLRCRPQKQLTLIKALRQQMNDFDEFELERLRHAFVRLSGGDSRVARLTPEKIR